jgi:hypothetical protein
LALGAYIQPDSVVDTTRPELALLAQPERIKVRRLRGVVSMGLLIAAPEGAQEGDDVAAQLGVTRYEPPAQPHPSEGEGRLALVGGERARPVDRASAARIGMPRCTARSMATSRI